MKKFIDFLCIKQKLEEKNPNYKINKTKRGEEEEERRENKKEPTVVCKERNVPNWQR